MQLGIDIAVVETNGRFLYAVKFRNLFDRFTCQIVIEYLLFRCC